MTRFAGRSTIITGAGGDIGAATALRMAREGARLTLFDRKLELLAGTAARCREAGAEVEVVAVDQTHREQVEAGVGHAIAAYGGVDVLFANAGYGKFAPLLEQPVSEWTRHVEVNLTGTFSVCQLVAQEMAAARRGGVIVVNASSGAVQYADQLGAYCVTKAALRMLTIGMASEFGIHRIRVNAVMPGVIETQMTAPMLAEQAHRDVILAETPAGRIGHPDDVAAAVCFLASDESQYITGQSLMIDGGQTIHGHPRWFRLDYRDAHDASWEIGR